MKVSFVSRWGVQCGIATYTDQLIQSLMRQKGVMCDCLAEQLIGIKEISVQSTDARFFRCWSGRQSNYEGIVRQLKKAKPDIVHFQHEFGLMDTPGALFEIIPKIRALGIGIVFTPHTVMPVPSPKKWFFRDVLRQADAVVAHNEQMKDALTDWGLRPHCVHVIPHGTPENCAIEDRRSARKTLFLPEDPSLVVAISLGFISPGKMQHEAVEAVLGLAQEGLIDTSRFLYIIAGSPGQNDQQNVEYCRSLHQKIESARAWNFIRIIPRFIDREDLPLWYGAADFVITGSHQTFFSVSGRSHQEMAYGMPSVSSNARLLSDLNEERSLKYDSMFQLRGHILTMVREPQLRGSMHRRCLDFAESTSWTNAAKKHIRLYEKVSSSKEKGKS
jgi:glycosyltransferase involved in cell wall biosynthesis